mgnify:CR=1 FL=1
MKFQIKTRAEMEQVYQIEAQSKEEAEKIALGNTEEIFEQTQIDAGEIIMSILLEE